MCIRDRSGSRTVLERMRRRYTPEDYRRVVEEILKRRPESCIGNRRYGGISRRD